MKRLTNAYKQLVLYLDGTLPPPKKNISETSLKTFIQLQHSGISVYRSNYNFLEIVPPGIDKDCR